jgi:TonB family protein
MALPAKKPTRRWGWMVVLGLFVFAAGLAAGPYVHDQTFALIDSAAPKLAARMPRLFGWLNPVPPVIAIEPGKHRVAALPALPASAPSAPPAARPAAKSPPVPAKPAAMQPAEPVAAVAPRGPSVSPLPAEEAPVRADSAAAARAHHGRPGAKAPPAPKAPVVAAQPAKKSGKEHDPFDMGDERGGAPAPSRKTKTAAVDEPAPAKSEPAPKPSSAKSGDALDNLMADVMTETKGKGKKRDSKGLDAMLKDVQKSEPAPVVKHEEPVVLEPLSASDIAKAMGQVKTRANDCAQRLGSSGVAELKITVGKNGRVSDVRVGGKVGNTPLGSCIEKAVRAASFRPNAGLTFDYRIDAR